MTMITILEMITVLGEPVRRMSSSRIVTVPRASACAALLATACFSGATFAATYYIDYVTGLDANSGTSKSTPWKRHPYMKGWSGGSKYAHSAGDIFIFKGGVSWTAAVLPMNIPAGGSTSSPDYYGVDTTWYAGSAFSRPVFDAQGTATNGIVSILNASNITIDNIEMRDVVFTDNQGDGLISIGYVPKNILIKNSYLHKWTLADSVSTDDAHGGVIVNTGNVPPVGIVIDSTTISNAEYSSTKNNGVAVRNVQTVSNSDIHDVPTAILFVGDVHGNHIYRINYPKGDFDPNYHTNLIYMAAQSFNPPMGYIYNNHIHDIGTGAGIYVEPCFYSTFGYATMYVYNNVAYNSYMGGGGIILVDPEGGHGSCGSVYVYQNTLQQPDDAQIGMVRSLQRSGTNRIAKLITQNNFYIGPNDEWDVNLAASSSSINNLQYSNTAATAAGYTAANLYRPSLATSATVNRAAAISCADCPSIEKDRLGVVRGQGGAWDIGAYEYGSTTSGPPAPPQNLRAQ